MRYQSMPSALALAGLIGLSGLSVAGPSDHSFAWTHQTGNTAVLEVNGSTFLTATHRGWVDQIGNNNFGGPSDNYIAGVCGSSDGCSGGDDDHHNYFAFDLAGLAGNAVTTAVLRLSQPSGPNFGFLSQLPSLSYSLFDVLLNPTTDTGLGLFVDLGSGTSFASVVVDSSSNGSVVAINFNAAGLAALQASAAAGSAFYVGGAVAAVPEPQSYALLLLGLGLIAGLARSRKD